MCKSFVLKNVRTKLYIYCFMKKSILFLGMIALMASCAESKKEDGVATTTSNETELTVPEIKQDDVIAGVNLTVAEGKRLIAKGIANHPKVKDRLERGMVIVITGSTNTYIARELTGETIPPGSLMTGNITPHGVDDVVTGVERIPNIVLVNGKWEKEIGFMEALGKMGKDDIVFKGANMLNYERQQAAINVRASNGGTITNIREQAINHGRGHLIVPIGLEKEVHGDLREYTKLLNQKNERLNQMVRLIMHEDNAEIFTEIEAIKTLASVNVIPFASGGLAGREGGISLAIYGSKEEVQKVLDVVSTIQGEEPFVK